MSIASHIDAHSPERVPVFIPARFPACERSWHGEPPVMMSTGSTLDQSTVVTSCRFGTSGQWCARTADGALSNSTNHAGSAPSASRAASSRPPYPANSAPVRSVGALIAAGRP